MRQGSEVNKERNLQIDVAFRSSFFMSSTCSDLTSTWQTGSARMAPYRKRGCPERLSTANSVSVKDQVRDRCRRSVVVGRWLKRRGSEVSARPRAYRVEGQRTECRPSCVGLRFQWGRGQCATAGTRSRRLRWVKSLRGAHGAQSESNRYETDDADTLRRHESFASAPVQGFRGLAC